MIIEITSSTLKKILVVLIAVLLVGGIGYFVYSHNKCKNEREELASNINKAGTLSMFIIQDYAMTWQAAIKNENKQSINISLMITTIIFKNLLI